MKVKVQDLTGLALVWAVAANSGFHEVIFVFRYNDPRKEKPPTQVMVSRRPGEGFWFRLDGDWAVEKMKTFRIGVYPNILLGHDWLAVNAIGSYRGRTLEEAVAKCWLDGQGVEEVELPPELLTSGYPPENEHGY